MPLFLCAALLALIFADGWTDAPNAIAGPVATGALSWRAAVRLTAAANLAGAFCFWLLGGQVAQTMLELAAFPLDDQTGLCALTGCFLAVVAFSGLAWLFALPTSESHSLMAAILGSSLALGQSILWESWLPVLVGLLLSVALAFSLGWLVFRLTKPLLTRLSPARLDFWQRFGAAANAFSHGGQDCQKSAAMLALALALTPLPDPGQLGCILLTAAVMALGTLLGGRRIIQKTAVEMVSLQKEQSVAADLSAAASLGALSLLGLPVSTTHTKIAAIAGSCTAGRQPIHRGIAGQVALAWVCTFPLCGLFAFGFTRLLLRFFA